MAIAPGTRVGPYEVDTLLGAGGIGEVYKARDMRLARTDGEIGAAQEVFRTTVGGSVGTGLAIDGQRFLVFTRVGDQGEEVRNRNPLTVVINSQAALE